MANDGKEPHGEATGNAVGGKTDHSGTYDGFIAATKWGVALIAIVLILMAIFLA